MIGITEVPEKVRLLCAKELLGAIPNIKPEDIEDEFSPFGAFFMGIKMLEGNSFSTVDTMQERENDFQNHLLEHANSWERKWGAWHEVEQLDSDTIISLYTE